MNFFKAINENETVNRYVSGCGYDVQRNFRPEQG